MHVDLCGPITPTSTRGKKYFYLLVDEYSRWIWVYNLYRKFEVLGSFKRFKLMVEKSLGYELKTLRIDRGGEFSSKELP